MSVQIRSKSHRRRLEYIQYLLRATFTQADQGYADAQVIDRPSEGIERGTLTVVEVDGTLAIVSGEMAFTAQGTPNWGDEGVYSQAVTRRLGLALLGTLNKNETNTFGPFYSFFDSQSVDDGDVESSGIYFRNDATIRGIKSDGGAASILTPPLVAYAATTDYECAVVLGGFDSSGNPYYAGQPKGNYTYGSWLFVKGGALTAWTLLWLANYGNTTPVYGGLSNHTGTGTVDDILLPDYDFSPVQWPVAYSSFTAGNGTSLDAITPEVGGTWTERTGNFDIQTNRANISVASGGRDVSTVQTPVSDLLADVIIRKTAAVDSGEFGHCLRYSDGNNFWMVQGDLTNNQIEIVERNGGVENQRAAAAIALTHSTDYDLRAIADGQTIDAFLDEVNSATYALAALNETATIHGVVGNEATQTFDNYVDYRRDWLTYDREFAKVGY